MATQKPYKLQKRANKGLHMVAARDIQRGERILAEEALITFPPIPKDLVHPNHFLTEGMLHSGEDTINAVFRQQTPETVERLRSLMHPGRQLFLLLPPTRSLIPRSAKTESSSPSHMFTMRSHESITPVVQMCSLNGTRT